MMRVAGGSRKGAKIAKTQRRREIKRWGKLHGFLRVFATFAPLRELPILAITLACMFDSTSVVNNLAE